MEDIVEELLELASRHHMYGDKICKISNEMMKSKEKTERWHLLNILTGFYSFKQRILLEEIQSILIDLDEEELEDYIGLKF